MYGYTLSTTYVKDVKVNVDVVQPDEPSHCVPHTETAIGAASGIRPNESFTNVEIGVSPDPGIP